MVKSARIVKLKHAVLGPLVATQIEPFCQEHHLERAVVHTVQWDILGALMEHTYRDTGHDSSYFLELLAVYEAGHYPAGWRGRWPQGTLVVL
jgi:hypothetical protein